MIETTRAARSRRTPSPTKPSDPSNTKPQPPVSRVRSVLVLSKIIKQHITLQLQFVVGCSCRAAAAAAGSLKASHHMMLQPQSVVGL
jgi:hypothetical protein